MRCICLIILLFTTFPLSASQILYLLRNGEFANAIDLYEQRENNYDLELVQNMGLAILEHGFRSGDPEIQLLTLFGAGISGNDKALYILEKGIQANHPQFQLVAINFLSRFQNDQATALLNTAMSSPFLPIRLEAVYNLTKNKNPKAAGQIEALMQKVPPEVLPIFPKLLAMSGDRNSINALKRLLTHPLDSVRTEAILSAAKYGRDDLLREIRRLSMQLNVAQQEACAIAFGALKDEASVPRLQQLSRAPTVTVKLAAMKALFQLGREEVKEDIEALAWEENLFAITLLGEIPGSEETLKELLQSPHMQVRINAALALLKRHEPDCLKALPEILIKDRKDLAVTRKLSFGKGLHAWKAIPSARQNFSSNPVGHEISLAMREEVLAQALSLPEKDFLSLADLIFKNNQKELVPALIQMLVNLQSPEVIAFLQIYREKIGAPLIRNYCNLALFKLKEPGPYNQAVKDWVLSHHFQDLIQLRPMVPMELHSQVTPEDTSRLLVGSLEALVQSRETSAVEILLKVIRDGNPKNRYALAGLLLRVAN